MDDASKGAPDLGTSTDVPELEEDVMEHAKFDANLHDLEGKGVK